MLSPKRRPALMPESIKACLQSTKPEEFRLSLRDHSFSWTWDGRTRSLQRVSHRSALTGRGTCFPSFTPSKQVSQYPFSSVWVVGLSPGVPQALFCVPPALFTSVSRVCLLSRRLAACFSQKKWSSVMKHGSMRTHFSSCLENRSLQSFRHSVSFTFKEPSRTRCFASI